MSLLGRLFNPSGPVAGPCCAQCRHFVDDPRLLEAALPGLKVLSSGYGSVRGDDGLCVRHDRFAGARSRCAAFTARLEDSAA